MFFAIFNPRGILAPAASREIRAFPSRSARARFVAASPPNAHGGRTAVAVPAAHPLARAWLAANAAPVQMKLA